MNEDDVLFEERGSAGLITLNRPQALNALTLDMVRAIDARLRAWEADRRIASVAIRGAGGRAFCAGGDVRSIYDLGLSGRKDEAVQFWRDEYRLNALIKRYRKPYLALIEGFVMGGGVGVAIHGSHRVACGKMTFAMPEVAIGLFPDVGGTYFLPRLPPGVGLWLALTGERLGAADARAIGLIDYAIATASADDVLRMLSEGVSPDEALRPYSVDPGPESIRPKLGNLRRWFQAESVEALLANLDAEPAESPAGRFAREIAATIRSRSPTSVKIAFEQMRRGGRLDFAEALRTEFRIASRILDGHDYYEGVRATVIDKDKAPRWRPPTLAEVSDEDVAAYFAPLGENELKHDPVS